MTDSWEYHALRQSVEELRHRINHLELTTSNIEDLRRRISQVEQQLADARGLGFPTGRKYE